MKTKFMRIGLMVCTCIMVLGISAFAAPKSFAQVVAKGNCKFYDTAQSRSAGGTLHKGVSVDVTDIYHGRYQISLWGQSFWVNKTDVAVPQYLTTKITAKKGSKVYAKADDHSKAIAQIAADKTRKVLAYSGPYMKIKVNGKTGWVNASKAVGNFDIQMKYSAYNAGRGELYIFNNFVKSFVGTRCAYGATGPDAFDSSGFLYYCFTRDGVPNVPRTIKDQYQFAIKIPRAELGQYKVVFFDQDLNGTPDYGAIVINKNQAVCAANARTGVKLIDLNSAYYKKHYLACGSFVQ